ncbi:MAG: OsmC family protein [Candidatus Kapabacteria bacterium]|nr:OsmC family protein [Candidatus Kapabacteria bacterium]
MKRTASAHWEGTLREGNGNLTTQSTILAKTQYSFKTRFEEGVGTNPEELVAAAHAGCFTMAIAAQLSQKGFTPTALDTNAVVSMEGLAITGIHLETKASVPNLSAADFAAIAADAKTNCIISKILNVPITLDAQLL